MPNGQIRERGEYSSIFKPPYKYSYYAQVDYQSVLFREMIILVGCCAGYVVMTMVKKV